EARATRRRLVQREADGDGAGHLDRRPADLAVTLREVQVADREQGAGDRDREPQPAARDELADVEVASRLAWRDRPPALGRRRRPRRFRKRVRDRLPPLAQRLLAPAELLQQRVGRRDADDARERLLRYRDARQLRSSCEPALDLPLDEVRVGEEVGEVAEPGNDRRRPEIGRLVLDELHLEDVARLRAADVERARQRMPEAEVQPPGVGVGALARQLIREPVLGLEPYLLL